MSQHFRYKQLRSAVKKIQNLSTYRLIGKHIIYYSQTLTPRTSWEKGQDFYRGYKLLSESKMVSFDHDSVSKFAWSKLFI